MLDVREEPDAQRAVDAAMTQWSRANDAWESITWVLARDPEYGEPVTESGQVKSLTLQGGRSIDLPTVTVIYTIEQRAVVIHSARFANARAAYVGHA